MSNYHKQTIDELGQRIRAEGFRVFIAESGTHGFFTDTEGTRVVSFGPEYLHVTFSGNYETDKPQQTGTGWRISDSDAGAYSTMFRAYPPHWAVGVSKWRFTTLEQYLAKYQQSSKFRELKGAAAA